MASRFVHLHAHSHYSLLQALPKIPELVAAARTHHMPALALTDNGNLYGAISFYKECLKQNVKPIIGVDCYLAPRSRHDKEAGIDRPRHRLVLLAENEVGYRNLIKLVTYSHTEGFYYRPRIDRELMERYAQGLIALLPSYAGEVAELLRHGDAKRARDALNTYRAMYGEGSVFLEVTHHPELDGHASLQQAIRKLAQASETPLVAAQDIFYIAPEDARARQTLVSVGSGEEAGSGRLDGGDADFSFISPEQADAFFADVPGAIDNTFRIAERCTVELPLGKWVFPNFEIPDDSTYDGELEKMVTAGFAERKLAINDDIKARLNYELSVIKKMGYAPYFLVVGDLIRYARVHGILTTIRGSVAGSLVIYLAGITTINPLEYELPFERFLNPDRPSPPDIDMDFADNRRDEMIEYVRAKYGADKVAQIGTFGTMMARGSVRDTARALGFEYAAGDRIARLIPFGSQGFPMSIDRAIEETPDLKKLYETDEDSQTIIDMARKIEGCARHISIHAAGVVISPVPLTEVVPTQLDAREGKLITQYDMHAVEDAGLLKFDFLGLTNLAVLADSVARVHERYGAAIDIEQVPLDDEKTFDLLSRGETMGVFQLAGGAMTGFLKELKPSSVHDINAMVALYRPGPMRNIPEYIARKHGEKPVTYYHPKMEAFLKKSYGILVYQDDLISTAIEVAGYTWRTVDAFRKAVGKKIPAEMAKQHKIFVQGCIDHSGMSPREAEGLWELFEPFQGYGFNKAHAACYGRVSYQTAYMKAHFPVAFMASVLTADSGDLDKVAEAIAECKRMAIDLLPPNVNESVNTFTIVSAGGSEAIRFGLASIKNFGEGIGSAIALERMARGPFRSLADFLSRVKDKNLNKKALEALIRSGALDLFGERGIMHANIERLIDFSREIANAPQNQTSLFSLMSSAAEPTALALEPAPEATAAERLSWEKEHLGLYVTGHPLDAYRDELEKFAGTIRSAKEKTTPGGEARIAGIVEDVRAIVTKNGERMAFIRIADFTGVIEAVAFPRLFKEKSDLFAKDRVIALKGRLSDRNGELSIVAEAVRKL